MGKVYKHDKFIGVWSWSSPNFWSKIVRSDENECWRWTGSTSPYGPLFGVCKQKKDGKYKQQMTQARRVLFAEHNGRVLGPREGVYHTCHNKNCMSPHHLTLERQRRPQEECLRPGPKPKPKEITFAKTKVNHAIEKLNKLSLEYEAN